MRNHLAAFAVAISICGQAAWATDYTIDTYDFPGAATSGVTGINAAGRIVGHYTVSGTTTAGLFGQFGFTERNGIYTSVGDSLPCRPSGRCRTGVQFLNNFGLFAGAFSGDVDFPGAFSQSVNSAPAVVQPPEYPNTEILLGGLNDLGELAGCYSNPDLPIHIFTQIGSQFRTISLPAADALTFCPVSLNNLGQLAGQYATSGVFHGFILTGSHLRTLDLPAEWNGEEILPLAINDLGFVTGTYEVSDPLGVTQTHGFVAHGDQIDKIDFPGAISTSPSAINNRGEILGTYEIATTDPAGVATQTFTFRAGVYSTVTLPLPGPGPVFVGGFDNFGRLFGSYTDSVGTHGFVATPKVD